MSHTLLHARIQDLISRGGGSRLDGQKTVWTCFSFYLVLYLFYSLQRASNGLITEKTILSKDPEGVQHFPGGPTFLRRSKC